MVGGTGGGQHTNEQTKEPPGGTYGRTRGHVAGTTPRAAMKRSFAQTSSTMYERLTERLRGTTLA